MLWNIYLLLFILNLWPCGNAWEAQFKYTILGTSDSHFLERRKCLVPSASLSDTKRRVGLHLLHPMVIIFMPALVSLEDTCYGSSCLSYARDNEDIE